MKADEALGWCDSQDRAAELVRRLQAAPSVRGKQRLLREWFNMCDALAPWADQLREQFELAGFVTDVKDGIPSTPVMVYRGAWHDDDLNKALSWTTDRAIAERFARGLVGMRSRLILGTYREDSTPTIFTGACAQMLGYFDSRGEKEVVCGKVLGAHAIAELVAA